MEELVKRVQKMLIEEYRLSHPEASYYSDEEIALINPVAEGDITAFIALEKDKLQKSINAIASNIASIKEDIELSEQRIADPKVFSQDKTETRRDIVDDNIKIAILEGKKRELLQKIDELDYLDKQEDEKRSR